MYNIERYDNHLLFEAGKLAIEKGKASIGMFQRTFKIGFNYAARIMDELNDIGAVGVENGTHPREILMTMDEFQSAFQHYCIDTNSLHNMQNNAAYPSEYNYTRIQMYNGKYDYMDGLDFEFFCADLLKKNNFYNVSVTPGSADQGIDIIAFKDGVKYGIQCKCYSSDIGNKAVQEVFAGAKFYDCHVPVVLTNRYFTNSAIELAEKINVLLWDRDRLESMLMHT